METVKNKTEIFSTEKGVLTVDSPVKKKILSLLSEGDKTQGEIREAFNKAKSTISVHLSDLRESGLIEEKPCPSDKRKKIFSLRADPFGKTKTPSKEPYEEILKNLRESSGESFEFVKNLFHLLRYGFESFGIDMTPALKVLGRDAGESIGANFESENIENLIEEIQIFFKNNNLGELLIENENDLVIFNCFDCSGLPNTGSTVCTFYEGLFEGIIKEKTDIDVSVREAECFAEGNNYCRFKIDNAKQI